jgi:hypothetical protein
MVPAISLAWRTHMKVLAGLMLVVGLVGGAASAYAGGDADGCHSISDSVYGSWGCR